MATDGTQAQLDAAVQVVERVLGSNAYAVYLYGSAVAGGLRPHSDLDLLVIVDQPTTSAERSRLAGELRPISRRGERPPEWRPLEVAGVTLRDLKPLRTPPRIDFQYGEWLREDLDAGRVDPAQPDNPDLLVLLAQARASGRALRGPDAGDAIPEIPRADLKQAMLATVDSLQADLASDTTNVLLTLARIAYSLESNAFTTKDAAAEWVAGRIGQGAHLRRAAAIYRGEAADEWAPREADQAARELMELIRG